MQHNIMQQKSNFLSLFLHNFQDENCIVFYTKHSTLCGGPQSTIHQVEESSNE